MGFKYPIYISDIFVPMRNYVIFYDLENNQMKDYITTKRNRKNTLLSIAVIFSLLFPGSWGLAEPELPAEIYTGAANAREIIQNISFQDVAGMPSNYWAKGAIYEMSALEAIKGYGDRSFRGRQQLSKEEAIALIYRMMGREDEAQKLAEQLDAVRSRNMKKEDAISYWSDGYLQLAANDGLITRSDLMVAFQRFQPKSGTKFRFVRADPAERQEVAYWIARAIKLEPVYEQQNLFNSYNDWNESDPPKIPYIEAILQNKIMNGMPGARFDPTGSITREQMAQVLKNMENIVLPMRSMEKRSGYIEGIYSDTDAKQSGGSTAGIIAVRGEDGKLYHIARELSQDQLFEKGREFSPGGELTRERELVVYKNDSMGTGEVLEVNDQLEYIVDADNQVKFVRAVPASMTVKEMTAMIVRVDRENKRISVQDAEGNITTYSVSDTAELLKDSELIDISEVNEYRNANIMVRNNLIIRLELKLASPGGLETDITGIVEDNNPALNYISLYNEVGLRAQSALRVYNYSPDMVEVEKNHKKASLDDIEPGDTVHILLDQNGYVSRLSAADNYEAAYGKILFREAAALGVELNDGTQQVLDVAEGVIVFSDKQVWPYGELKDGEYIRMLLQKTPDMTVIREITRQTYAQDISNIYKAVLDGVDISSGNITLKHPEKLYKGKWVRDSQIGFRILKADDRLKIYDDDKLLDLDKAGKLYTGKQAYIAVKRSFGSEEVVQQITFKPLSTREILYDDTLASTASGNRSISLDGSPDTIRLKESTIVVRDGKLVTLRSLMAGDAIYMAADRDTGTGLIEAGVVVAQKKPDRNPIHIYRGKLSHVNENSNFTLESFALLDGLAWEYSGFSKTFAITFDTRLVAEGGTASVRGFVYGSEYMGKSIYVAADETQALLISTAPYGAFNARGEVFTLGADTQSNTGGDDQSSDESGEQEGEAGPTKIRLTNATVYDSSSGLWTTKGMMELNILPNTIIIRDNELVSADSIEKGDTVRVLKKDDTASGDAYLILIQD